MNVFEYSASVFTNGGVRSVAPYRSRTGTLRRNFVIFSMYGKVWELSYLCVLSSFVASGRQWK